MSAATETVTRDQAVTRRAVDRLTEAIAMLNSVAADMTALADTDNDVLGSNQIASFARSAADTADTALMVASNEANLAEREASSNALTPAQQEALGRPCLCYPRCAAEG